MKKILSCFLAFFLSFYCFNILAILNNIESSTIRFFSYEESKNTNLSFDFERKVVEHGQPFDVEVKINSPASIKSSLFSVVNDNNITVSENKTRLKKYGLKVNSEELGENYLTISASFETLENTNYEVESNLFIFSTDSYDFISTLSMDDAKFYCYEVMSNSDNISFEEYDQFYNISHESLYEIDALASSVNSSLVSVPIAWTDANGDLHIGRNIKVEYLNNNNTVLGVDYTDFYNGRLYNSVPSGTTKYRISSSGKGVTVRNASNVVYSETYSGTVVNCVIGNTTDRDKAFQVHQAMQTGAQFIDEIDGTLMPNINVRFPGAGTYFDPQSVSIDIHLNYVDYWDALLHEYGHYVAYHFNLANFTIGGEHYLDRNIVDDRFIKSGVYLAWNEGWASFFSIISQKHFVYALGNIPYSGDNIMQIGNSVWNLETMVVDGNLISLGEGNEVNVAGIMYYMYKVMTSGDLWTFLKTHKPHLLTSLLVLVNMTVELENLLVKANISSYNLHVTDECIAFAFHWEGGGGSFAYPYTIFTLMFYDQNKVLKASYEILGLFPTLVNGKFVYEYILSFDTFNSIQSTHNFYVSYWSVVSAEPTNPTTGCYSKITYFTY